MWDFESFLFWGPNFTFLGTALGRFSQCFYFLNFLWGSLGNLPKTFWTAIPENMCNKETVLRGW